MFHRDLYPKAYHLNASPGSIAKYVILGGDPLRAKYIAEKFLTEVHLVSDVRGMFYYTGIYKGQKVTIGAHGMGSASIAIYVHELYEYYDVECIIRVGTSGGYDPQLKPLDLVNVTAASGENNFDQRLLQKKCDIIAASSAVCTAINTAAGKHQIDIKAGNCHSAELFYLERVDDWKQIARDKAAIAVEMECYTLFIIAQQFQRQAGAILTIAGSLVTGAEITSDTKETGLKSMAQLALESVLELAKH